jgi:hypothetical protein
MKIYKVDFSCCPLLYAEIGAKNLKKAKKTLEENFVEWKVSRHDRTNQDIVIFMEKREESDYYTLQPVYKS